MDDATPRIKWPNLNVKNPTVQQLKAWYGELQKYFSVLQEWDARLEDKESMLNLWEMRLLAKTEGCSEEFEDEECDCDMCQYGRDDNSDIIACDYDRIGESDKDTGMQQMKAADMKRLNQRRALAGLKPMNVPVPDAGAQKDIAELERIYALPDKRRKRK